MSLVKEARKLNVMRMGAKAVKKVAPKATPTKVGAAEKYERVKRVVNKAKSSGKKTGRKQGLAAGLAVGGAAGVGATIAAKKKQEA